MIAYVAGKLAAKKPTEAIVDVQGIGYRVLIPASTYEGLPATGKPVKLITYHHVREQDITLFGFATDAEREVFETMLGVSGVGPKLGLAALSALSPQELRDHVVHADTSVLTKIPGVGKKTAQRLIVELNDRMADLDLGGDGAPISGGSASRAEARKDALAALESLGLARASAEKAIRKVLRDHPEIQSADKLVKLALREK